MVKAAGKENPTLNITDANVTGGEIQGWKITFNKTGNRYVLSSRGDITQYPKTEEEELIEKYILGEDKQGIDAQTIIDLNTGKFYNNDIISDAADKLKITGVNLNSNPAEVYFTYNNTNNYKATARLDGSTYITESVVLTSQLTGREGKTVKYSYDGSVENEKDWTILYDYGDTLEIISPDSYGSIELGVTSVKNDEKFEKVINDYNNYVRILNDECQKVVTNPNKIRVRSVGTNPYNPFVDSSSMYSSDNLSNLYDGKYNGKIRGSNAKDAQEDIARMEYVRS